MEKLSASMRRRLRNLYDNGSAKVRFCGPGDYAFVSKDLYRLYCDGLIRHVFGTGKVAITEKGIRKLFGEPEPVAAKPVERKVPEWDDDYHDTAWGDELVEKQITVTEYVQVCGGPFSYDEKKSVTKTIMVKRRDL